jgi:hypothetical protein
MREKFRGYYAPTGEELQALWSSATIVLDANVLLDFHRYEADTSATYLELATFFKDRLWLPFQAAHEYHENRITVRSETTSTHKEQIASIEKLVNAIGQSPRKSHLTAGEKHKALLAAAQDLLDELKKDSADLADRNGPTTDDPVLAKITTLYEGKVGDEPSKEALAKLHTVGAERFAKRIPPGYKDQAKEGDRKYGDYMLWQQVLDHAKEHKTDIILVTEDAKEDWWVSIQGKQIMPRPELIKEFRDFTGGRSIHLYNGLSFFNYASHHAHNITNKARIAAAREELEDVAQQRADDQTMSDTNYRKWLSHTYIAGPDEGLQGLLSLNEIQAELMGTSSAPLEQNSLAAAFVQIQELEARATMLNRHIAAREEAGTEPGDPATDALHETLHAIRADLRMLYNRVGMTKKQQQHRLWRVVQNPRETTDD